NLLYVAYGSRAKLTDTDIVLLIHKRVHIFSSFYLTTCVIVAFLTTALRQRNLRITSDLFKQGFQAGINDAFACKGKLLTLNELSLLVTYRHGGSSAHNAAH